MLPTLQPILENDIALIEPLQEKDLEEMYAIASDPKVWEQNPHRDRYQRTVFETFFREAMDSQAAFKIVDKRTNKTAGCSRFYKYDETEKSIYIGYTFYGVDYWGTGLNPTVKKLLLDYIFQYVDKVFFDVGATNFRSQIAVGRLGAVKVLEHDIAYSNKTPEKYFLYELSPSQWNATRIN